jgi:hypothetical protein
MHAHERLIRRLFTAQRCRQCAASFQEEKVVVLAQRAGVWMVLASCVFCGRRGIFLVSFPGSLRSAYRSAAWQVEALGEGALTEAVLADAPLMNTPLGGASVSARGPVTGDDVLAMRHFLRHFTGNFAALFASPPGGERYLE